MNLLSDEQLIARCASGDRLAMDVLVSRYHCKLLDFAFRQIRDREAAADIAQAALVKVFKFSGTYSGKSSFRTWLYSLTMNLIRDEVQLRKRRGESLLSEIGNGDSDVELQSVNVSTEDAALGHIESDEVWSAVGALPDKHKQAMLMRFRHGLKHDEIAEVMRVPCPTVRSWIHQAIKSLRKKLR